MTTRERQKHLDAQRRALKPTLRVGDKVRLNQHGLVQVFGHTMGLGPVAKQIHTITFVDQESMTFPDPTFPVEVEDPELNMFLIDDRCFDLVPQEPKKLLPGPFDDMPPNSMFCR